MSTPPPTPEAAPEGASPPTAAAGPTPGPTPVPEGQPKGLTEAAKKPAGEAATPEASATVPRRPSRPTRSALVVGGLAMLLGIAMSAQIHQTREQGLESLRQGELVAILDTVTRRSQRLDEEIARLTAQREGLQAARGGDDAAAVAAAAARVDALGVLTGSMAARGPGVSIPIVDPGHQVGAATLLDAVQELRDAGAEAIQIDKVRFVASSHITEDGAGQVFVDGQRLPDPYEIIAIADPQTMASALRIPGGVVETVRGVGASITVTEGDSLRIDALHAPQAARYARPESSSTAAPTAATQPPGS